MHPTVPSQSTRAFTLVELLVVLGVIVILVALVLAAVARSRSVAVRVTCTATLRQYAAAQQIYLNEYDDSYVPVTWGFNPDPEPPWPPPPAGLEPPTIEHAAWPMTEGLFAKQAGGTRG